MDIPEKYLPISGAGREELKTIYSWSIEDAIQAQELWCKAEHRPEARGPLFQWVAAQKLKELADHYEENNDPNAILEAIYMCALDDIGLPSWCTMAYLEAYRNVYFRSATSWDSVFGKPHPTGTHANDHRKRRGNAFRILDRVNEIIEKEGLPVDGFLFERVGLELGVGGKTKTSELYYEGKRLSDRYKNLANRATDQFSKKHPENI